MDNLREKLLKLIREIDAICKKYNITYYAEGGTAIGALRHNGFIPWDDDLDLVITRDNFNKFVEAFNKEKIPNRILEFPENNKNFPVVTVKYTDTASTSIFRSLLLDDCAGGVNIDFFILDPIPKGREKWFKKNFLAYTELLCPFYVINNDSSQLKYLIDSIKVKIFGKDKVLANYRKKLFCFTEEGNEEYLIRFGITYQTVKIDYYKEPRYIKFEDMMLPVPIKAEQILSDFFGEDWHIFPEIENQITHNVVQNLDISYKYYKKDYMRFINRKIYKQKYNNLKKLQMDKKDMEVYNSKHISILNSFKESLNLNNEIKLEKVIKLFEQRKYADLRKYTSKFFKLQNRGVYKRNNILLDVDLDTCYYSFLGAIMSGEYYNVSYIIDLFKNKGKRFEELISLIDKIKQAKSLYYTGQYNASLTIVNDLLQKNKDNTSAYKIKLDIILKSKMNETEYKTLLNEINNYYKLTEDIELYKYIGDVYYNMNQKEKANVYYEKVKENSRNGLILLDIANKK